MRDEVLLSWTLKNWITIVLMVIVGWWLWVGVVKLVLPKVTTSKGE